MFEAKTNLKLLKQNFYRLDSAFEFFFFFRGNLFFVITIYSAYNGGLHREDDFFFLHLIWCWCTNRCLQCITEPDKIVCGKNELTLFQWRICIKFSTSFPPFEGWISYSYQLQSCCYLFSNKKPQNPIQSSSIDTLFSVHIRIIKITLFSGASRKSREVTEWGKIKKKRQREKRITITK